MPATDLISSPTSASRITFTAGVPPMTAASNSRGTPLDSASRASSAPCSAISALLAVTTGLPALSAASTAALAGQRPFRRADRRLGRPGQGLVGGDHGLARVERRLHRGL